MSNEQPSLIGHDYDLVVIGAGTGANGVSRACAQQGWRVAVIDALPFGGTCALRGCDPKKMLVGVTEALDWSDRMRGRGHAGGPLQVDWPDMMAFKRTFTDAMPPKIEGGFERLGIEVIHGRASFVGPNRLHVDGRTLTTRYAHVATGARPATLGFEGEEHVASSTDFLELESRPDRIAFVGGGFISFEFAHIVRRAGASHVSILHGGASPLVHFDPDLVALQVARTRAMGIDVRLQSRVVGVEKWVEGYAVHIETPDAVEVVECDLVVHGAGRVPDLDGLDLEAAGVEYGPRGISVADTMRSVSNPAVFAAGDCADTGAPNLTPVSANEARIAAKNLLAEDDVRHVVYPPIPSVVFTVPPVAAVGLLELEAREQGVDFDVKHGRTDQWYSSVRVAEAYSAYKVLIERGSGRIVGAHIMGPGAEEQVNIFAMAMGLGVTANALKGVVFAYPSAASDVASMV
jgi:glutathione reductase (NADPH)